MLPDSAILEEQIQVLEKHLPEVSKPLSPDLFSISGHPYFEAVLSNWFEYFLESDNPHLLCGLFAECFKELITGLTDRVNLEWLTDQIHCIQEVQTKNGNFIDLIVYDDKTEDGLSFENALIIEHKVEAALNNDLDDYFNSTTVVDEKCGVVLSAYAINKLPGNYINITYYELIPVLEKRLGSYTLSNSLQSISYLKDFVNNLKRMDTSTHTDELKFCFEHGQTIARVAKLKQNAEAQLANLLRIALEPTAYKMVRKNAYSLSIRTNDDQISLVIELGQLFSEKKCTFQYWLYKEATQQWNKVPDHSRLEKEFGAEFEIRSQLKAKEWVELLRGTIDLSKMGNDDEVHLLILQYLEEKVDPINKVVREEMAKYNA
ncbi:MAG: hypothetical protein HEP71_03230 [Roseivirga sp.]|nr:hypothetical protein [Roseivirga sp.]